MSLDPDDGMCGCMGRGCSACTPSMPKFKTKTKIYYSIQNGGDGSAHPMFCESKELAEWDQSEMEEGWGESCDGYLEIESDGPITVAINDMTTHIGYLFKLIEDDDPDDEVTDKTKRFMKKFFPDGIPEFTIEEEKTKGDKYHYHNIFIDGKKVHQHFTSKSIQNTTDMINRLNKI